MTSRMSSEDGVAMVMAIVLLTIMLGLGLASYAYVDTQQRLASVERIRESAFNMAEGVHETQAFGLARNWPSAASPQPACTQATGGAKCPVDAALRESFAATEIGSGATWSTSVHDDYGNDFYDAAAVNARPSYDENRNNRLWLRSEATVQGQKRAVVSVVQLETLVEAFPRRTVLAGRFRTTNDGQKTMVETGSSASSPHFVTVRCAPAGSGCLEYRTNSTPAQINPPGSTSTGEYVGQPAVPQSSVDRLKQTAMVNGTYYPAGTCPPTLTGAVVYIESADPCSFTGNTTFNGVAAPGIVVMRTGKLSLGGGVKYFGLIYHLNQPDAPAAPSTGYLVEVNGNASVSGAVFVDGSGGVSIGSSGGGNLVYSDTAFSSVKSYANAGVVQNTWREIPG